MGTIFVRFIDPRLFPECAATAGAPFAVHVPALTAEVTLSPSLGGFTMRLTSGIVAALLVAGLIGWAGCDNDDATRTGNDTNNTGSDARTAGDRTSPDTGAARDTATPPPPDTATGTTGTGSDTAGTSGTGAATPTTSPSDTTGGT